MYICNVLNLIYNFIILINGNINYPFVILCSFFENISPRLLIFFLWKGVAFVLFDFLCLYTYEFWLSRWKIVRSSVILLLPLLYENIRLNEQNYFIIKYWVIHNGYACVSNCIFNGVNCENRNDPDLIQAFLKKGGLILKRQTSRFHYGSKGF
jgi:hypothetical protein